MGGGKHNKGCCPACEIVEDDFDRDASSLGSSWTHETDDWTCTDTPPTENGYAESQADGAIAIHNTSHPLPSTAMHVAIEIVAETWNVGEKYRVIVNAVDKDSYHFAEFLLNGASDSVLRLGSSSGGTDTILISEVIDGLVSPGSGPRELRALISDDEFCAKVSHSTASLVYINTTPISGGYKAGMGTDEGLRISHFRFRKHAQDDPTCDSCYCKCEDKYIPLGNLIAHLEGVATPSRMSGLDCDIVLEPSRAPIVWNGADTCCSQDWDLQLNCPGGPDFDVHSATLIIHEGCIATDFTDTGPYYITSGERYANENSTCNPFYLEFGPFNVGAEILDGSCGCNGPDPTQAGQYYISITEAP